MKDNKPLMIAAGFTLAALVFLLWSYGAYKAADAEAADAVYYWEQSASDRAELARLSEAARRVVGTDTSRKGDSDVPTVMGELLKKAELPIERLERIDLASTTANEQSAHRVQLSTIGMATMGAMLETIRVNHRNLIVREIIMSETKEPAPGYFNWTLLIGVLKPEK